MEQSTYCSLQSTVCNETLTSIIDFPHNYENLTSTTGFSEPIKESVVSVREDNKLNISRRNSSTDISGDSDNWSPMQMVAKEDNLNEPSPSVDNDSAISSSSSATSSTVKIPVRRKRSLEDKICRVCGDKAVAHNFDVISCGSCRVFFRRNALKKDKIPECSFQTPCTINIRTRRFCSACRLNKCFTIGMRADMINNERRQKAHPEKMSVKNRTQSHISSETSSDSKVGGQYGNQTPLPQQQQQQEGDSSPQTKEIPRSTSPVKIQTKAFHPVSVDQLPSDPLLYWRLTEDERTLLNLISANYEKHVLPMIQMAEISGYRKHITSTTAVADILDIIKIHADQAVKLMKGFQDFRKLEVDDQLSCLKACSMSTFLLMGITFFLVEQNIYDFFLGDLSITDIGRLINNEERMTQLSNFARSMKIFLENDTTAYALLQCVIMFDPSCPNIKNRRQVNMMREKYMLLFKHYLESKVSYVHAYQYIMHIAEKLNELNVLSQSMTDMFRNWTDMMHPLMMEMLSFK